VTDFSIFSAHSMNLHPAESAPAGSRKLTYEYDGAVDTWFVPKTYTDDEFKAWLQNLDSMADKTVTGADGRFFGQRDD